MEEEKGSEKLPEDQFSEFQADAKARKLSEEEFLKTKAGKKLQLKEGDDLTVKLALLVPRLLPHALTVGDLLTFGDFVCKAPSTKPRWPLQWQDDRNFRARTDFKGQIHEMLSQTLEYLQALRLTPTQFLKVVIQWAEAETEAFKADRPSNQNSLRAVTRDSAFKVPVMIVGEDYATDITELKSPGPRYILVHPAYSSNLSDARTWPASAPEKFDAKRAFNQDRLEHLRERILLFASKKYQTDFVNAKRMPLEVKQTPSS